MLKAINKPDWVHKARRDRGTCYSCNKQILKGEYYSRYLNNTEVHNNCSFTKRSGIVTRCSHDQPNNLSGKCEKASEYENQNGVQVCEFHKTLLDAFTWESRDKRRWVNLETGEEVK